jgi:hypothetical protein
MRVAKADWRVLSKVGELEAALMPTQHIPPKVQRNVSSCDSEPPSLIQDVLTNGTLHNVALEEPLLVAVGAADAQVCALLRAGLACLRRQERLAALAAAIRTRGEG